MFSSRHSGSYNNLFFLYMLKFFQFSYATKCFSLLTKTFLESLRERLNVVRNYFIQYIINCYINVQNSFEIFPSCNSYKKGTNTPFDT